MRYAHCVRVQRLPVRHGNRMTRSLKTNRETTNGTTTARDSATVNRTIPASERSAASGIVETIDMPSAMRNRSLPSRRSTASPSATPATSGR